MADKHGDGMKSAYEIAMERLSASDGNRPDVSAKTRKALAEVDEKTRAGIAEKEILLKQRMVEARASGEVSRLPELEEELRLEIRKLKDRGEAEKDRIRKGEG